MIKEEKYKVPIVKIYLSDIYVTKENEVISTTLGSCIAVCLYDEINKVFGMNHFMLPGRVSQTVEKRFKYGWNSISKLIEKMEVFGANKKHLKAKIFGGAFMLNKRKSVHRVRSIGERNIEFTRDFLSKKNIPIVNECLGGELGRKIYFVTINQKVFVEELKVKEVAIIE